MPSLGSHASVAGATAPAIPASSRRLPVWQTVRETYAFLLRQQGALARLAAPWLFMSLAVGIGGARLGQGELAWSAAGLIDWLGGMALTVAWLRLAVAGTPAGWCAPFNARVVSLLLRLGLVVALCALPGILVVLLSMHLLVAVLPRDLAEVVLGMVLAAVVLAAGYAMLRLQLWVVAGALGVTSFSLLDTWEAMRGNTLRLAAAYVSVGALGWTIALIGIGLGVGLVVGLLGPESAQDLVLPSMGGRLTGPSLLVEAMVRAVVYGIAALYATVLAVAARHVLPTAIASPAQ